MTDVQCILAAASSDVGCQRWAEALAGYEKALRLHPESAAAYYGRACALDQLGRWVEATDVLRIARCWGAEPPADVAELLRPLQRVVGGYEARVANDLPEALEQFKSAEKMRPGNASAALFGRIQTLRLLGKTSVALRLLPAAGEAEFQLELGWLLLEEQQYRKAQDTFARLREDAGPKHSLLALIGLVASLRLQDEPVKAGDLLAGADRADYDKEAGLHVEAGFLDLSRENAAASALRHFVQARDLAPDSVEAAVGQARALRKQGLFPEAAVVLDSAPRPGADAIGIERGFLLLDRREPQRALEEFDRVLFDHMDHAMAIAGKNEALRQQGKTGEAARLVGAAAQRAPDINARIHRMLGELAYDEHRYEAALKEFTTAIKDNDRSADTLRWRCRMLRLLCRFSEAGEELRKKSRFPEGDRRSLDVEAAWLAFDMQQYAEAQRQFERLYPDAGLDRTGLEARTAALRAQRNFSAAELLLQEFESRNAQAGRVRKEWGWLAYDQRAYEAAAREFASEMQAKPGDADARRWLAAAHREAGKHLLARRELTDLGDLAPTDPGRYQEEGWVAYDQGFYDEARERFEMSLTYHPTDERSLCGMSATLRAQQRFDEAKEVVDAALKILPESRALGCELGLVDLTAGRPQAALRTLSRLFSDQVQGKRHAGEVALAAAIAAHVAAGGVEDGLREAEKALTGMPDSPEILCAQGWALLATEGRLEDAKKAFGLALRGSPRHPAATYGLVQTLLRQGQVNEAAKEIEWVAQEPHAYPQHTKALAVVRFRQDRYEQALELLEAEGLRADPEAQQCATAALRMLRRYAEAEERARTALQHRSDHQGLRLEWARSLFGQRRYEEAEAEFEWVRSASQNNESATIGRSECLRRLKRHGVAEAMLHEPATAANTFELRIELGRVYYEQHEPARAVEWFNSVLQPKPEDTADASPADRAAALAGLALIDMDRGRWSEADHRLGQAVAMRDSSLGLKVLRAWFFLRRADRIDKTAAGQRANLQLAEDLSESVLLTDRYCAPALACLGVVAQRRGQFQAAESFLQRAIALDRFSSYHVPLATVLTEVGRHDDAVDKLRDYLLLKSSWYDAHAHMQLGTTLLRAHHPAEAVDELRIAATLSPEDVAVTTQLAAALVEDGRASEAEELLADRLRQEKSDSGAHALRLTLGWVMLKRTDVSDNPDLRERVVRRLDAWKSDREDPEFYWYSAVARMKLAEVTQWRRAWHRKAARDDLKRYFKLIHGKRGQPRPEAERLWEMLQVHPSEVLGHGLLWAGLSLLLLLVLWGAFLAGKKGIDGPLVAAMTPVLIALALVASALPVVSKLKVAGVEAEMRESHPVPQEVSASINFPHIAAVVTARETLWTGALDPVEHPAQELTGYMLPARPLTTSSKVQQPATPLAVILKKAGMPSGGPTTAGAAFLP